MDIISTKISSIMWLYKKTYFKTVCILVLSLIWSCSNKTTSNRDIVQEFYKKAKNYEPQLSVFYNVSFTARGLADGIPMIPRIDVALDSDEIITLPGIRRGMSDNDIKNSPFFKNIEIYAKKMKLADSVAYEEVVDYSKSIINLAHELEIYRVQSTPRLGRFIIFSLSDQDQVVYKDDLSSITHEYWKKFFESSEKLGDNWYYRRTN